MVGTLSFETFGLDAVSLDVEVGKIQGVVLTRTVEEQGSDAVMRDHVTRSVPINRHI
ncbi:hypothetical protein [Natrialba aegyptia]|uniref:hypothetical protein n=1 Tax=Natrialba aegyptia TaxID=129789 RepID=UPI0013757DBE|nr:hypothetical protein [Natrialba aegyptia]